MIICALVITTLLATASYGKEITVRGKLQKTVEAGGWLIVSGDQKYLILNSRKFANEKWFVEGSEVEATGEVKKGVMTIYMEGTPFDVHSLRATATKKSQSVVLITSGKPAEMKSPQMLVSDWRQRRRQCVPEIFTSGTPRAFAVTKTTD
jgi:hypothetical protein